MPPFIRQMSIPQKNSSEVLFHYVSVGNRVGPKAANDFRDVMLVQTMLRYLYPKERGTPDSLCPYPNGYYDKPTARVIHNFQLCHELESDWYIDPLFSRYSSVAINRRRNLFTMAKLYFLVQDKAFGEPIIVAPVIEVLRVLAEEFPIFAPTAASMRDEAMNAGVF